MRLPTFAELRKFVETEGWEDKDRKSRKKTGAHHRYTLTLGTGEVLYTRISHGSGQVGDPNLWRHILRDQLQVTGDDFWACVDRGVKPPRPQPEAPAGERSALDAKLVRNLIRRVGLSEADVAALTREEAIARWQAFLSSGGETATPQ